MTQRNTKSGLQISSIQLSPEQLRTIEEMAGVCFTPQDIAIVIGIDWETAKQEFKNKKSDFYLSYKRGELVHMLNVRKSIYDLAKGGSSASQTEFLKLRKEADTFINKQNIS